MAYSEQSIHNPADRYEIPAIAFADVNVPTEVEVLVWATTNIQPNDAEGSLLWYGGTATNPTYVWNLFVDISLNYHVSRSKGPTTEWLSGVTTPNNSIGKDGDFYFKTPSGEIYKKIAGVWSFFVQIYGAPGPAGPIGPTGPAGSNGSDGNDGTNGDDGREVELINDGTNIKWRYVGDVAWTNLVAIGALTGATGPAGPTGPTGPAGMALTVDHSNTTMVWNSFNFFEDADGIANVSIASVLPLPLGSLLGVNNAKTSGNIHIDPGLYSLVGYPSSPFTLTPDHGVVFVYLGSGKIAVFSIY